MSWLIGTWSRDYIYGFKPFSFIFSNRERLVIEDRSFSLICLRSRLGKMLPNIINFQFSIFPYRKRRSAFLHFCDIYLTHITKFSSILLISWARAKITYHSTVLWTFLSNTESFLILHTLIEYPIVSICTS